MADKIKIRLIKKTKSWDFIVLEINKSDFVNILPYRSMHWVLHEGFKA